MTNSPEKGTTEWYKEELVKCIKSSYAWSCASLVSLVGLIVTSGSLFFASQLMFVFSSVMMVMGSIAIHHYSKKLNLIT